MEHRQYAFKSVGRIKYDPYRPGLKTKNNWWCVIETCNGLSDYYRWLLERRYMITTLPPSWGSHISIVRGEQPKPELLHLWKKYDGMEVEFEYTHDIFGNGDFWWVNVYTPITSMIRQELQLKSDWGHHLTIAKVHEKWPVRVDQMCLMGNETYEHHTR